MTTAAIDTIAGLALVLAAVLGVLSALLAQIGYAAARGGDVPDAFSTPAPLAVDFGASEILEHGDRARARERSAALQVSSTACLVATSLLSVAAAKPLPPSFAAGGLGIVIAIAATIASYVRWRNRDRTIEMDAAYGAIVVRYKVGGRTAIEAAFAEQYPKLARRRQNQGAPSAIQPPEF